MSRLIFGSLQTTLSSLKFTAQNQHCIQCIRFYRHRKPFWLPMGKTKMFRITKKVDAPKEEVIELARLINGYRTKMKSLR